MSLKALHKWLAIFVFLQLLVWLLTGFLLGKVDHKLANGGDTFLKQNISEAIMLPVLDINSVLEQYPLATEVALTKLLGKPVYNITISKGFHSFQPNKQILIDRTNGNKINLDNEQAIQLARMSFTGEVEVTNTQFLRAPIEDISREQNPVWRVETTDVHDTSIYVSAQNGQIIAHVNNETRWRDLLLMLHFMDYAQQGSFNNIFIKIFAVLTLLQALTGLYWGGRLLATKQYTLYWFSKIAKINVYDTQKQLIASFPLKKRQTLLSGLTKNGVLISSICGGGGVCGKCRFKSAKVIDILSADIEHIPAADITKGYRLACQHFADEVTEITVERQTNKMRVK